MTLRRFLLTSLALVYTIAFIPNMVCAQTTLKAQGTARIENFNATAAEKDALRDSYNKAILLEVMRSSPGGYAYAIAKKLPVFLASRGMQDIIQYQVTSRSQQDDILTITAEFKIKENFLQDWLYNNSYTVATSARPKILLAVSSNLPGENEREWWISKGKKGYNLFETIAVGELSLWGENVVEEKQLSSVPTSTAEPLSIAGILDAQLLLRGTLKSTPLASGITQYQLSLSLINVATNAVIGSWNLSRKGDLPAEEMLKSMVATLSESIRSKIAPRIDKSPPPISKIWICIDNISRFSDYRKMHDTLAKTDGVEDIQISNIAGHSICHTVKYRGNIEHLMQLFKAQIPVDIDIIIRDDTVHLSISN